MEESACAASELTIAERLKHGLLYVSAEMIRGYADIDDQIERYKNRRINFQVITGLCELGHPVAHPLRHLRRYVIASYRINGDEHRVPASRPAERCHGL